MRALLLLFISLAVAPFFACAADNRTDESTKKSLNVLDESDERMTPLIPLDTPSLPLSKTLKLGASTAVKSSSVFKNFELSDDPFVTLTSPSMKPFMEVFSTTPNAQKKLSRLLTGRYGHGRMAASLVRARDSTDDESTKAIVTILLKRQLKGYLQRHLTCVDVLKEMEMHMIDLGYFSQKLAVLEDYIKLFNKKYSGRETLLNVLTSGMGEDKLIQSLAKVKRDLDPRRKAVKVESLLVEKWKSEEDLTPTILLNRLKIQRSLNNLESLEAVMEYIRYYNSRNRDAKFSLLTWLTKDMDEAVVAARLAEAKKSMTSQKIATMWQEEQFDKWLGVQEPFSLRLNMSPLNDDQKRQVVKDFIWYFLDKPVEGDNFVKVLISSMGGEAKLLEYVIAAKSNPLFANEIFRVEDSLIRKWEGEVDLTPEILLDRLKIHRSLNNLESLGAVLVYIRDYNSMNPDAKFSLLTWLTKDMDEAVVAMRLVEAKKIKTTETTATAFQQEQFDKWLEVQEPGSLRLNMFPLDDDQKAQVARDFIMYFDIKFINKKKPQVNPPDLYNDFLKGLGDGKFAIMLSEAIKSASDQAKYQAEFSKKVMFKRWYDSGVTPSNAREKFFSNLGENVHVKLTLGEYEDFYSAIGGRRVRS